METQEAMARDAALDALEHARPLLIARATETALRLCARIGEVAPTDVWHALHQEALHDDVLREHLRRADPRWMGAVFRRGWRRLRWEPLGSHGRPVPVWTRA